MIKARIPAENFEANLKSYEQAYQSFSWTDMNKEFTWQGSGKINITYEATGVRPSVYKYSATVWFMLNPQKKPEAYPSDVGHHAIRFGCLVLKQKHPDSPGLDHVAFAKHELDTPYEVADFIAEAIKNDPWDGGEKEDEPIAPSPTPQSRPSPAPVGALPF